MPPYSDISKSVLAAFSIHATPQPLPGGQGHSILCDNVVLKPGADEEEAAWLADLVPTLSHKGFRTAKPVPALDGRWTVEGWSAWTRLAGQQSTQHPHEILQAGRALEKALAGTASKPDWMARRQHPWAVADRMVWGEQPLYEDEALLAPIRGLWSLLKPVRLPHQLIHGDLAGNTLFAEGLPPGIIDLSFYWRASGYGLAIAAVDLVDWYGAPLSLFVELKDIPEHLQLLARAELFRVLVYGGFGLKGEALEKRTKDHLRTIEWLCSQLS